MLPDKPGWTFPNSNQLRSSKENASMRMPEIRPLGVLTTVRSKIQIRIGRWPICSTVLGKERVGVKSDKYGK
jgi:hypothetical protein